MARIGRPVRLTQDELRSKIIDLYGSKAATLSLNMFWRFCYEISPGDRVIARRGLKRIIGVGTVTEGAFYNPEMGQSRVGGVENWYPNFIRVNWQEFDKGFPQMVFGMLTLYEIDEARFREFTEEIEPPPPAGADVEMFYLEKYLQEFIVTNWNSVLGKELELIGPEYLAEGVGKIDILARMRSSGAFVVIELKKGLASSTVVGQTLGYIGWVKENLCIAGEGVKGLIISRDGDAKLDYAARMLPDVSVKYYRVSFRLVNEPEKMLE